MSREPVFDKYYVVTFPRLNIESNINVLAADIDLKTQIGEPKKSPNCVKSRS